MKNITKTPEKLLDAAVDLFAANGFGGTSVRDIARLTGLTVPSIYYHFGNKEGLLIAILERAARRIMMTLSEIVKKSDVEPMERFKMLLNAHFDLLINDIGRKEANIVFIEEERVSRLIKPFQIELMNIYRQELKTLQSLGYVKQENITILTFNIFGVINWHLRWYKPGGKMSPKETAKKMIDFILNGISCVSSDSDRIAGK